MADEVIHKVSKWKIALPIVIGLGVVVAMLWKEARPEVFANFHFTFDAILFLALALVFMAGRDLGYMIRIRLFSDGFLTWKQAFRVIMLWEFTSAITPSTVGGTSVAVVFVHKEGLSVGKSATMVMLTAFYDELLFVLLFPLLTIIIGNNMMFGFEGASAIMPFVWGGWCVKLGLVLLLSYGLFFNPNGLRRLVVVLFKLPLLRRWRYGAIKAGADIVLSSKEIKNYRPSFWFKAFAATFLSWCSRFLVANMIFMAFFSISDHLVVFARQFAMWVMMIISPTPGGSGFAEYIFQNFLGDILPVDVATQAGTIAMIALIWRLVTYYPYLFIGAFILPKWLANMVAKSPKASR